MSNSLLSIQSGTWLKGLDPLQAGLCTHNDSCNDYLSLLAAHLWYKRKLEGDGWKVEKEDS